MKKKRKKEKRNKQLEEIKIKMEKKHEVKIENCFVD